MAHMSKHPDGTMHGPYPNKRGEFCGNHRPGSCPLRRSNESTEQANRHHAEWLSKMRFGKPGQTQPSDLSLGDLAQRGLVGLYLLEDRSLYSWETAVETDALTEAVVSVVRSDEPSDHATTKDFAEFSERLKDPAKREEYNKAVFGDLNDD